MSDTLQHVFRETLRMHPENYRLTPGLPGHHYGCGCGRIGPDTMGDGFSWWLDHVTNELMAAKSEWAQRALASALAEQNNLDEREVFSQLSEFSRGFDYSNLNGSRS